MFKYFVKFVFIPSFYNLRGDLFLESDHAKITQFINNTTTKTSFHLNETEQNDERKVVVYTK